MVAHVQFAAAAGDPQQRIGLLKRAVAQSCRLDALAGGDRQSKLGIALNLTAQFNHAEGIGGPEGAIEIQHQPPPASLRWPRPGTG